MVKGSHRNFNWFWNLMSVFADIVCITELNASYFQMYTKRHVFHLFIIIPEK
jgi:hypothetical protein